MASIRSLALERNHDWERHDHFVEGYENWQHRFIFWALGKFLLKKEKAYQYLCRGSAVHSLRVRSSKMKIFVVILPWRGAPQVNNYRGTFSASISAAIWSSILLGLTYKKKVDDIKREYTCITSIDVQLPNVYATITALTCDWSARLPQLDWSLAHTQKVEWKVKGHENTQDTMTTSTNTTDIKKRKARCVALYNTQWVNEDADRDRESEKRWKKKIWWAPNISQ